MPQGTWSRARFFIHYVHDCQSDCWSHKYIIDDTSLSESCLDQHDSKLQEAADYMSEWCSTNGMKGNRAKTKEMRISFKRQPEDLPPIIINDDPIEVINKSKTLGTTLSDDLGWRANVEAISTKAYQRLHSITLSDDLGWLANVEAISTKACQRLHSITLLKR